MSVKALSFSHWTLSGLNTFRKALSYWTRLSCSLNYRPAVLFKHFLVGVVTFSSLWESLWQKNMQSTPHV